MGMGESLVGIPLSSDHACVWKTNCILLKTLIYFHAWVSSNWGRPLLCGMHHFGANPLLQGLIIFRSLHPFLARLPEQNGEGTAPSSLILIWSITQKAIFSEESTIPVHPWLFGSTNNLAKGLYRLDCSSNRAIVKQPAKITSPNVPSKRHTQILLRDF